MTIPGNKVIDNNISKTSTNDLPHEIKLCMDKISFHIYIIKELHKYIVDYFFRVKDVDSDKKKMQVNELAVKFTSSEKPTRLEHFFEQYKNIVSSHINNSAKSTKEKESEFKEIINVLTKGISSINYENREFNTKINNHSEKLKEINRLDDIVKIKKEIMQEIEQVNVAIKVKEEQDTNLLQMLSEKVAVLDDDLKKAKTASMTDSLTGVFNRLAFDNHIDSLIEKMGMRLSTFSIMMIDIDNFKSVNDTYGHLVGDRVIISAVDGCRRNLRRNDFMARYGGEEFVIVLEGSPLKIAQRRANDICKTISSTPFVIDKKTSNESLSFTVSIGASVFRKGDTALTVLNRADKALYIAKNTGKNRAVTEKEL